MSQNQFLETSYEDQDFRGMNLDHQVIRGITFSGCSFTRCSFEEAVFAACRFEDCVFRKCNLSLIKVGQSTFRDTRFEGSKVIGVNWVEASWGKPAIQQHLRSIDFFDCVMNYSSFIGLTLVKTNIKKCMAMDVDFSDANLKQANCAFSDLTNSRFNHTDLTETDFSGAKNYSIHPNLNILKKTRFSLPDALSLLYNLDIEIVEAGDDESSAGSGE